MRECVFVYVYVSIYTCTHTCTLLRACLIRVMFDMREASQRANNTHIIMSMCRSHVKRTGMGWRTCATHRHTRAHTNTHTHVYILAVVAN